MKLIKYLKNNNSLEKGIKIKSTQYFSIVTWQKQLVLLSKLYSYSDLMRVVGLQDLFFQENETPQKFKNYHVRQINN